MTHTLILAPNGVVHRAPEGHPEHAGRLTAVLQGIHDPTRRALPLATQEAPKALHSDLLRLHAEHHLEALSVPVAEGQYRAIDADTSMAEGTFEAALHAAGGAIAAARQVMAGTASTAFVAARPPGHHALADRAMGFCFLGNAALAAKTALDAGARVAVLDFDVHHGNGTQALLWNEPNAFFASTHVLGDWPQSGRASDKGANGAWRNVPLKRNAGNALALEAWTSILASAKAFAPDLVVVSAGFDAHQADPLGGMRWNDGIYADLGAAIADLANATAQGRIVSVLEGGYNLSVLRRCTRAYIEGLVFGTPSPQDTP